MLSNTKMAVESTDVKNDNGVLIRTERIYSKQRQLQIKLSEINSVLIGSDAINIPELNSDCIVEYLNETEDILNCTLNIANDILQILG